MASAMKEIKFLAVARRGDKAMLAHRIHTLDKTYDYIANVMKVLNSPGWASVTTDKLSLDDGENRFYVLIDEAGRVFIAITSKAYPSRYIYSSSDGSTRGVLGELKKVFTERFGESSLTAAPNGLQTKAGNLLKGLADEFNDLKGIDKISNVQAKVDAVTGVMQKNIEAALKNTDRIEDIDEKAVVLADSAAKFKNAGGSLKRNMRCRYYKIVALFTVLIIAVLVIIIVPLVMKNKENK
jgi:hypothetical protein